jgi:hypothetical protein
MRPRSSPRARALAGSPSQLTSNVEPGVELGPVSPDPAGSRQCHSAVQGDHPPLRLDKAAAGEPIWLLAGGESSNRRNRLTSLFGAYVCSGLISGVREPDLLTLACHAVSGGSGSPGQQHVPSITALSK